jgi:hypothetical protein
MACLRPAGLALLLTATLAGQQPPAVADLDPPHGADAVDPKRT